MQLSHSLTRRLPIIVCLLTAIFLGFGAAERVRRSGDYAWPDITIHGTTPVYSQAAFVLDPHLEALIWNPIDSDAPLTYQPLDGADPVELLPYTGLIPEIWQIVPARADTYHIIWLEPDNRLRSALVHRSGATLLGPVEHSPRIAGDITAVAGANGHALIFWLTATDQQIAYLELDSSGRPGPVITYAPRNIQHLAATASDDENVHLAWLTQPEPGTWTVRYSSQMTQSTLDSTVIHTLSLPPGTSLSTFTIGLDQTTGYLILGTNHAQQPDHEEVTYITFDLTNPAQARVMDLMIPASFPTIEDAPQSDLKTGHIAVLTPNTQSKAPLRWPHPVAGQHDLFVLALALQYDSVWRPAVVYFRGGEPLGYQVVSRLAADAAPPAGGVDSAGGIHLTWAGLDNTQARRYTASTTGQRGTARASMPVPSRSDILISVLLGVTLSAAWIIIPAMFLLLAPANEWTSAALCVGYGLTKIMWPRGLLAHVPPQLTIGPLQHVDAALLVGVTISAIALIALSAASIVRHTGRTEWQQWASFVAVDISLTLIIFSTNLID